MRKIFLSFAITVFCLFRAEAQTFVINDVLVSAPNATIADTEFDPYLNRICWQTGDDHTLWTCSLNTSTWALNVPDGKEVLVDSSLVPLDQTSNGGEWGFDMNGTFITYNKLIGKTRYAAIAAEYQGSWVLSTLTDAPDRMNPHATQNPSDSVAAIQYIRSPNSVHTKYKFLDHPNWEHQVLWFTDAHWATNEQVLTGIMCNGQVGLVDPSECGFPEQLTNDPGTAYSLPFMWRAPEKGNQRMFFARANDSEIRIFKESGAISGQFTLYMSFPSPSSNPDYDKIASPEPVIYQGQSYMIFMVSSSPYEISYQNSEIWIAKIDSLDPLFRMVSDTSIGIRTDPEAFATPDSLLVYYTEVIGPNNPGAIYRLRKCDTGIGAGLPADDPENARPDLSNPLIYPNPFSSRISLWNATGNELFSLAGPHGQIIWTGKNIQLEDLSSLRNGMYYLGIVSGNSTQTIKVIKE
jgi:hypothetical protein